MPRVEDIAWKFVIRQDKKWRCPYCETVYSGSVTRVRSHFLKQPKEGIASCTKVPEHISTLMELLRKNQVHNKEDIAWKFVERLGDNKWRCHHCREEFLGDLTGAKAHLLGVPNKGISICTQVPDHVRKLMQSLLDEVAEEESRGANGQSSTEPQSRDMPTQAEVAEEEIRDANSQFSTIAQGTSSSPDFYLPNSFKQMGVQVMTATDIGVNFDRQSQAERQVHQSSTMPLWVQSSHVQPALVPPQHQGVLHQSINHETRDTQQNATMPLDNLDTNQQPGLHDYAVENPVESFDAIGNISTLMELLQNQVRNKEDIAWEFVNRLGDGKWRCHYCSKEFLGDLTGVKGHLLKVPNDGISICTDVPDHVRKLMQSLLDEVGEEESREANRQFFTEPESCYILPPAIPQSSQSFEDMENLFSALEWETDVANFTSDQDHQFQETLAMPSLAQSDHEMQMSDQQTPTRALSFQCDQLAAIGNSSCLQDGNRQSQLQVHPSIASQHTRDFHIFEATDLQVPEVATNTTGPSSSQDMNRGSPIMEVRSINANNEEIRNLKRKVKELDDKEAVIKEQMEIESTAFSVRKKPRILVDRWLKETERARNKFQIIGQAHGETLPPKEQVETLTREVEELVKETLPQTLLIEDRDAKGVAFLERKLIGKAIQGNIELIWDYLKANCVRKLGIRGMGGVGKTTIMMHIHNRLLKDATFDGVLFIIVSQDCSIYKLQSDIWKALKFSVMADEHEKKRAAMLSEQLERKKNCVLILDDVWDPLDLEEVGVPVRADGLKLVLTTRCFNVCSQMLCEEEIKVNPLSQQEAESLFLEELRPKVPLNLETEAIMKSIVKECAGLPIGVITMARSMRGVTHEFEWRDILLKLKESTMGQTDMENKVFMNLKFSYDRLGNPFVQQCFLSCALYPEDKLIDKFELVEFFIDQGLIDELSTRKEQYNRGLTILNKLGNVCLLEDHGSKMKMHDLIRDMALHIMSATSIVKPGKGLKRIPPEECWTEALEKVSLMENIIGEFPLNMSPNCPRLSTILLNSRWWRTDVVIIPDSFFRQFLGLKVLNLSGCHLRELPNSISDLVNLRALLLSRCSKLSHIPYLGKLASLRKLDVGGCYSLDALEGLKKLMNLRYLNLTETRIERLPKGILDRLLNLQLLLVSAVIEEEDITKLWALEAFTCHLKNVDDFNKCVRCIEQSDNPRYYDLKCDLHEDPKKSEFVVSVCDDARFGDLGRSVCIWGWGHAIVSVGREYSGIFILVPRDVQHLKMRECDGRTSLSGMGLLECLEDLEIEEYENLEVLFGGPEEEVIDIRDFPAPTPTPRLFPNLRSLNISQSPKLKYLVGHGSISNLPHLRKIKIWKCEEMVGIIAAVTSPPPHPLPAFPSLEEICIEDCGKMKRAVESEWLPHFPNLRRIEVEDCEKMEEIIGGSPSHVSVEKISLESLRAFDCNNMRKLPAFPSLEVIAVVGCQKMKRAVEFEWLPHFPNLRTIKARGCHKMEEIIGGPPPQESVEKISLEYLSAMACDNMRKLFPQELLLHLRNLQRIEVAYCEGMVEMISGAGQGQEGSIMNPVNNTPPSFQPPSISLPNLKKLDLHAVPQLKSICEVPISCGSMEELRVEYCPELKAIPLQLRLRDIDIEELPHIRVEDEEKWKTLMWDDPNAQAILQPYLLKWKHTKELNTNGRDFTW